jgi:desulfoferrodoxin (superoxide reductase-like protein)
MLQKVASRKARLAAQAAECNAIEAKHGPVRTAEAPGADGAGKEGKHVPSVCVSAEGSSLTGARSVMVTVPHGMDEKHFIERVKGRERKRRYYATRSEHTVK